MKNRMISAIIILSLIVPVFLNFAAWSAEPTVPVAWTTEGLYGGEIKDIQISSAYNVDHTIFVATSAGVFKSTDRGKTWLNLFSYGPYYVQDLALTRSFLADQTIFAGHSNGLLESTDGGISWHTANAPISCSSVAVSPNYVDDLMVFAGSTWDEGIAVSTDGGLTWSAQNNGLTDLSVVSLAVSPDFKNDNTLFAGTDSGIFKSEDSGLVWLRVLSFTRNDYPMALVISPNYAEDKTVLFGLWNGPEYKSTDGGLTWNLIDNYGIASFAISPLFSADQTIFGGTIPGEVLKSTDSGTNWLPCAGGLPREWVQSLCISPEYATDGTVFAGFGVNEDGPGLFKTTDGGTSWHIANGNMNIPRRISSLAIYQETDGSYELLAGADRNDVFQITSNKQEWSNRGSNVGGIIALSPDYSSDRTIFAASWNEYYVHKSTDGGISWLRIDNGLPFTAWWDMAISPNYTVDRTLFIGGNNGIYKSTNAGTSWIPSRQGLKDSAINEIEISPDYAIDQTLFAGGNNLGVFKSTDNGMNWQSSNQGLPASPRYNGPSIMSLAVSPDFAKDRTIIASVYSQGTYRSTDAGANWDQIYPRDASAIGISPSFNQDRTLFLSTFTGWTHLITMSRDGGQTWETLDTAPLEPSYYITSILVSNRFAEDHMIFCAGDKGVWKGIIAVASPTTTTTTTVPPVLVTITEFIAVPGDRSVSIQWSTASELDNAGFNMYRSDKKNGEYFKINTALIPAKGSPTNGASYEFIDTEVRNRKTYYYKFEDIDLNGKSVMHGPVNATPRMLFGIFGK
jgi:photosystem II stability/assembly factor-like uncharacterized protein